MAMIIAIDPGYTQSALVVFDGQCVVEKMLAPNVEVLTWLEWCTEACPLAIEQIESYGMAVGREVFETVHWAGRFYHEWARVYRRVDRLPRRQVKLHLCGVARAKDANIRQALIDRFGPGKEAAIGRKASPGPLYGIKADLWAALAVAVTWWDQNAAQQAAE